MHNIMKTIISRTLVILLALLVGAGAFGTGRPAVFAASGTDLIVAEITLSPAEPAIGSEVTITVAVQNQGDAPAVSSYVTCYVDETVVETESIESLAAGVTATASFTWIATQGEHTIKATTDVTGRVAESDETNNSATYSITTVAPDLVIQSITWVPINASRGDNIVFSVMVKNQGTFKSLYTSLDFLIDGSSRGYVEVPGIAAGESKVITESWIALSGRHTVQAVIDIMNNVKESDETNNELTVAFGTLLPDLFIKDIAWAPENPSKDDNVSFNITITNLGTGRADASDLGYYIDNNFITTIRVPALNAGASCNVTFIWKATLNAHGFRAAADYYKMVIESDEENNEVEVSLLTLPPDLMITNISWMPEEPAAGDVIIIKITLKNQGSGKADPSRAVVYLDGNTLGYLDYSAIAAGLSQNLTIPWTAVSGSHTINVRADYAQKITEAKEDNNQRYATCLCCSPGPYRHRYLLSAC